MNTNDVKEMISYYKMWKTPDGNVRMRDHLEEAKANIEAIRAAKPAILAYWEAEAMELADRQARRELAFRSIPGVDEVSAARSAWAAYTRKFNLVTGHGAGVLPNPPADRLEDVEAKYPDAVFALDVRTKSESGNWKIATIATDAYNALLDGHPVSEVRGRYGAEMAKFADTHLFD